MSRTKSLYEWGHYIL